MKSLFTSSPLLLAALLLGRLGSSASAAEPPRLQLRPEAQVASSGIFLTNVVKALPGESIPALRLADAPPFGKRLVASSAQVRQWVKQAAPKWPPLAWTGAPRVVISRRSRLLKAAELKQILTEALQKQYVGQQGQLDLRFTRPWQPTPVPDEPFQVELLDVPATGVSPYFMVRFDLRNARQVFGTWQASFQAHVWKKVWVARVALRRGEVLSLSDLTRERRDVLVQHNLWVGDFPKKVALELTEPISPGQPLRTRSLRLHPIISRGQFVEALLKEGPLSVTLRVEALQEGAPGELIRVRNLESRKEFLGKVYDADTVLVSL